MKAHSNSLLSIAFASAILCSLSGARGALIASFESGTLSGWNPGTLNGTTTTVNTDRATDGIYSAANTFTVPPSFAGWTVNGILEIDPRSIMDAGAQTLSMDVYSNFENPNGWGYYDNTIYLVLNYQGGFNYVGPSSGSLSNGSFSTLTFDMTPYASTITAGGLSYSSLGIAWHLGTYADNGLDNGNQTFAIDNINLTSVPEPSASVLGAMGVIALLRRRRI